MSTNIKRKSLGGIELQSGNGFPNHSAPIGSKYTDIDTGIEYVNTDINGSVSSAQFSVHTRGANLSSVSKDVIVDTAADTFFADNTRIEIKEVAAPPTPTRRRVVIC